MSERESISVVSDQVGSPTYAKDLAWAILQIIDCQVLGGANFPGVYHYSNEGVISWFEFAEAIKNISGTSCNVLPITTTAYPTPAKRPTYSVMDKSKIKTTFNVSIRDWQSALKECFLLLREA